MPTSPLASVLTPTRDRAEMLRRAVAIFLAYSYPNKEMVIVDDSKAPEYRPNHRLIRYVQVAPMVLGAKHNLAANLAQGDYLVHQDDDDFYSPGRLTYQMESFLLRGSHVNGLLMNYIRQESDGQFYHFRRGAKFKASNATTTPLYGFHDSTSAFSREVWRSGVQYSLTPVAQKLHLLNDIVRAGWKSEILQNDGKFVYVRHDVNTWKFHRSVLQACEPPSFAREAWFARALEAGCAA